jgi:hypothetical protein
MTESCHKYPTIDAIIILRNQPSARLFANLLAVHRTINKNEFKEFGARGDKTAKCAHNSERRVMRELFHVHSRQK